MRETITTSGTQALANPDYLTTSEAANLLGVSVGTVLNMVERGQLVAWRTDGGHRRISRPSVIARIGQIQEGGASHRSRLNVLIVEDEAFQRELYRDQFEEWSLPIDLRLAATGIEGLTEIGRTRPDILVIDLMLPGMNGFRVVRELRINRMYASMDIIVVSGLSGDEIMAQGGLPEAVVVWSKPIPFQQLRGFLDARFSALTRAGLTY